MELQDRVITFDRKGKPGQRFRYKPKPKYFTAELKKRNRLRRQDGRVINKSSRK